MSRCDSSGACYRVSCASLLLVALSFTAILTNVFVDIDHLLSKRGRGSTENAAITEQVTDNNDFNEATTEIPDYYIGLDTNDQGEGHYRSKRSLDLNNLFLRINNPQTKSYLTDKLATLLEALDGDDVENTTPPPESGNIYIKTVKQKNNIEINEVQQPNEDIIYLALRNLFQGLTYIDMHELLDKIQAMVRDYKREASHKENKHRFEDIEELYSENVQENKVMINNEQNQGNAVKNKMVDKEVQKSSYDFSYDTEAYNGTKETTKYKNPAYIFVDIKKDGEKEEDSLEDLQGTIKLIYNGKQLKIRNIDTTEATTPATTTMTTTTRTTTMKNIKKTSDIEIKHDVEDFADVLENKFKNRHLPDTYLKTITMEYLKKFEKSNNSMAAVERKKIRIKRNLESSYEKQTDKTPHTKDDDELFVEIETHFDKSGMEGEKKRKLVKSIIDKIQNAIRSSPENMPMEKSQREPLLKRNQSPLDREPAASEQFQHISSVYRAVDPISKVMPIAEPLPLVADLHGDKWKKPFSKPKFLSSSKSINSAEMNQLTVDYTKDVRYPAIPKRIQLPLSIDSSQENINAEDLGKLQLLFKDIEGTGFAIGYNQYVDQVPDPESIKLFHGIEDIVKKYHQKNDNPDQLGDNVGDYEAYGQELKKREVSNDEAPLRTKRFVMNRQNIRQSVKKINHHRNNEYNYDIYDNHYRSFNTYNEVHDIYKRSTEFRGHNLHDIVLKENEKTSLINPHRKKRAVALQTLMNSNKKMRVNKYLNTKAFPKQKRYYTKSKRSKRQVDNNKAFDKTGLVSEDSNMILVSDGKIYNNNLAARRSQPPELFFIQVMKSYQEDPFLKNKPLFKPSIQPYRSRIPEIKKQNLYSTNIFFKKTSNDYKQIQKNKERNKRQLHTLRIIDRDMADMGQRNSDIYTNQAFVAELDGPQIIKQEPEKKGPEYQFSLLNNIPNMYKNSYIFDPYTFRIANKPPKRERKNENPLMAKYPHVFRDTEIIEEQPQIEPILKSKEPDFNFDTEDFYQSPNVLDLIKSILPSPRNNYKVNIRLIPRGNENKTKPGFKEFRTTINKEYNKSGVLYSSQLNFTEISKVDTPDDNTNGTHTPYYHLETTPSNNDPTNSVTTTKPCEPTKEGIKDQSLLDIIIPSSPHRTFHLSIADLGKLLFKAVQSQSSDMQTEKYLEKTTMSTTTIEPTTTATTIKEEPSTYASTTVDPLKIKLLKAMTQNKQLTSQILNRIDQHTDILQAYLSKISNEIAKIPNMYTTTTQTIPVKQTQRIPVAPISIKKEAPIRRPNVVKVANVLHSLGKKPCDAGKNRGYAHKRHQ
ncbi:uncharacterized protein LOC125240305 [Leguminivora glycinivorella]|uniref:uncharacterized protein LOC125240305 n=1 Tax=Leguminivora glycinivorella TaxID=1035111 RepID=UPI002010AAD7|nr:uncharacterized protein LOC125240305 [Leguminivora glycinivorella]